MGDKKVMVSVSATDTVSVDQETVTVAKGDKNVKITWELDANAQAASWTFTSTGVSFKDNSAGQFDSPGGENNNKKFKWNDKNTVPGTYNYTINLQKPGKTASLDPAIQNEGDR